MVGLTIGWLCVLPWCCSKHLNGMYQGIDCYGDRKMGSWRSDVGFLFSHLCLRRSLTTLVLVADELQSPTQKGVKSGLGVIWKEDDHFLFD